ncbi:MAG: ROK family protein [Prolixibacteraceae bacterium]|nr:ROK family protein [Prolixibacteraceae bacterium]MBT6766993.1 ROK family protein [Prolixibacteraceae bacterium]MBT6997939.1 ROK family protein [Prolixibacteraceae bacterium]MBT7396051.1 ROK family protein [Prolixibacteraceae bacterium]
MGKLSIGVDIGGSHITSVAIDIKKRQVLKNSAVTKKVDPNGNAKNIIKTWGLCIKNTIDLAGKNKISGIGIAMPGPFDYKNGVALFEGVAKFGHLLRVNIKTALAEKLLLGNEQIRFVNDASAFGIGETWLGETNKYKRVLAITLGTGFGSSFLENGIPIVRGNFVPENGWVYNLPFENGIADDYFSTRGFVTRYFQQTGRRILGVKELAERYENDIFARQLFPDFGIKLACFLEPILTLFQADAIVLGGNISKTFPLFGEIFEKSLKEKGCFLKIFTATLKENAALFGSARLTDNDFFSNLNYS